MCTYIQVYVIYVAEAQAILGILDYVNAISYVQTYKDKAHSDTTASPTRWEHCL